MAKRSEKRNESGSMSKDAKVADIRTGSKSLAEAQDFSAGYGETMQHHINKSGTGRSPKRSGGD